MPSSGHRLEHLLFTSSPFAENSLIGRNGRELVLIVSRYRNIDNKGLLILAIISNRGTPTRAMSSLWIQQETRRIIVNMWRDFTVLGRVWQKEMTTGRDDEDKNGNQQTNSQTHQKINQFYWVTHPKGQQGQNLIATSWLNYMSDDISKDNKATKWQNKITKDKIWQNKITGKTKFTDAMDEEKMWLSNKMK